MSGFAPASASPQSRRLHAASRPDVARSAHAGLTPFCNAYFYDTKPGRFGCRPRRARIAQVERLIRAQRCIYLRFECACEETRTTRPDALLEAFRSCSTTRWARSRGRLTTWAQSQGASCKFLSGNPGFGRSEPGGQAVGACTGRVETKDRAETSAVLHALGGSFIVRCTQYSPLADARKARQAVKGKPEKQSDKEETRPVEVVRMTVSEPAAGDCGRTPPSAHTPGNVASRASGSGPAQSSASDTKCLLPRPPESA